MKKVLKMRILKKYGFYIMILTILSELLVPLIFAKMYPNYSQLTMLISDFGEDNSPIQNLFKIWQLTDGILFILTIPSFYEWFRDISQKEAKFLSISIAVYAIGDCLFTALFDRSLETDFNLASEIHDYGSGVGFVSFLIGTFLLIRLYQVEKDFFMCKLLLSVFILSSIFMILFAAPRIPFIASLNIPYRGLWQRLNLIFLYLPFFIVSVKNIRTLKNR